MIAARNLTTGRLLPVSTLNAHCTNNVTARLVNTKTVTNSNDVNNEIPLWLVNWR